jgi:transcriptional regulator with XRE-family HTH domain
MKDIELDMGSAVLQARQAVGWTIRDLAEHAGLSVGTISKVENDAQDMTITTALKIARALNIKLIDLIGLAEALKESTIKRSVVESQMRLLAIQMLNNSESLKITGAKSATLPTHPAKKHHTIPKIITAIVDLPVVKVQPKKKLGQGVSKATRSQTKAKLVVQ